MNVTGICTYETPCGWCTKWDKKCDMKIGHNSTTTVQTSSPERSALGLSCYKCKHFKPDTICYDCHPIFKNFELKEN